MTKATAEQLALFPDERAEETLAVLAGEPSIRTILTEVLHRLEVIDARLNVIQSQVYPQVYATPFTTTTNKTHGADSGTSHSR